MSVGVFLGAVRLGQTVLGLPHERGGVSDGLMAYFYEGQSSP